MTNVFISYSRKDTAFARRLFDALTAQERSTWADWEGIPYSADFWREIQQGIDAAEVFVYIISPDSLASMVCNQEVAHARSNNKRVVPIMHRTIDERAMAGEWFGKEWENTARENWIELKRLNWLFFRQDDDFDKAFTSLMQTIDHDPELVRFHTRMLVKAREWEAVRDRDHGQLLRGEELQAAEAWLKFQADKPPKPTDLHVQYIEASIAQRESDAAAELKRQKRLRLLAIVLSILLVFAVIAAAVAINRTQVANQNADLASTNEAVASRRALEARSLALAANAQVAAETDSELALALAVEANTIPDSPLLAQSILSRLAYEGGQLLDHLPVNPAERGDYLTAAAFSPDGSILAVGMSSGVLSLWDGETHTLIQRLENHQGSVASLAFNTDGTLLLSGGNSLRRASDLRLWTVSTGKYIPLEGHIREVSRVAFTPEGMALSTDNGGVVRAWNSEDGALLWETDTDEFPIEPIIVGSDISPDGEWLYVSNARAYEVIVVNTASGAVERTIPLNNLKSTTRFTGCFDIQVHPDGKRLLCAASIIDSPGIYLSDLETGDLIRSYQPIESFNNSMAFVGEGSRMLTGTNDRLLLWDTDSGRLLKTYYITGSNAIAISPDETKFAVDGNRGTVSILDLTLRNGAQDGEPIAVQSSYSDFAYDNTRSAVWVTTMDERNLALSVRILDEVDGGIRKELPIAAMSLHLLPDGSALIGTSDDNTFGRWRIEEDDPVWSVDIPNDSVSLMAIDQSGSRTLTSSLDGNIVTLWDTANGAVIHTFDDIPYYVLAVELTPDGVLAAAIGCINLDEYGVCQERHFFVWETDSGVLLYSQPSETNSLAVTPDGKYWATSNLSNQVVFLETATGQFARRFYGHSDGISALAFSTDGSRLISGTLGGSVFIWDTTTGFPLRQFEAGYWIRELAWTASGNSFISLGTTTLQGGSQSFVVRWRLDDTVEALLSWTERNRTWRDFTCGERTRYDIHPLCDESVDGISAVASVPTRTPFPTVVLEPTRTPYLRTETPIPTATSTITPTPTPAPYVYRALYGVRWSPDGTRLLAGENSGFVVVWDVASRTELYRLEGHDAVASMNGARGVWSPDGSRIVTYSAHNTARIWDGETGTRIHILTGHTDHIGFVDWSPDDTRLVSASDDGTARVWDAQTGEEIAVLEGHNAYVGYAKFSPDGTQIATASDDGTARVWDTETGQQKWMFAERDQPVDAMFQQFSSPITVTNVIWSLDGSQLIATGTDGAAIIWDPRTGERLTTLRVPGQRGMFNTFPFYVADAQWSPDGQHIVLASLGSVPTVWDISTGQLLFTLEGHIDLNLPPRWSTDGNQLITAGYDGTIRIWDAKTGQQVRLMDHGATLFWAEWSPDGTRIASVADNGTVRLWDSSTGVELPFVAAVPASQIIEPQVTLFLTEAAMTSLPMQMQLAEVMPTFGVELTSAAATASTYTPSPWPAVIREARPGGNLGHIPETGGEIWHYAGQAGETLTISVNADKPANRASSEERRAQGLLDVYVIVRTPDGIILVEVDDIEAGILTDALVENLQLRETGVYEIEVRGWENQSGGEYTLAIEVKQPGTPAP